MVCRLPLSFPSSEITHKWPAGRHGSTFGGNPVSCAAALATIQVIEDEKLCERAAQLGEKMMARLKKFAAKNDHIGDIRGRGLMIGIEFNDKNGNPCKEIADGVAEKCLENKLLVLTCGYAGQVIRLIPPLTMSEAEMEKGLEILEKCMTL